MHERAEGGDAVGRSVMRLKRLRKSRTVAAD
jgi:hypothetical protein